MAEYAVERGAESTVVRVAGEIDAASADELRRAGLGALDGSSSLEIDLNELTFLDSAGLNALVGIREAAMDRGTDFVVIAAHPTARRVIALTGLTVTFGLANEEPIG